MKKRFNVIFFLSLIPVGIFLLPICFNFFWLNLANISTLHQDNELAAHFYEKVFSSGLDTAQLRFRAALVMAQTSNLSTAHTLLHELSKEQLHLYSKNSLGVSTLVDVGLLADAAQVIESKPTLTLLPNAAAKLALFMFNQDVNVPINLVANVFSLPPDSPGIRLLAEQMAKPDFWQSETGRNLKRLFHWHGSVNKEEKADCIRTTFSHKLDLASLLHISVPTRLGTDLIVNGDFEQTIVANKVTYDVDSIISWYVTDMSNRQPWNRALFFITLDKTHVYNGLYSLRIDGLVLEYNVQLESARSGMWQEPIKVEPRIPYVISFAYCTKDAKDFAAKLYLSSEPQKFTLTEQPLVATNGKWHLVTLIGMNPSTGITTIQPALRLFGEGTVWYDAVSVRPLLTSTSLTLDKFVNIYAVD